MDAIWALFDGNWFDIASLAVGLLYALLNRRRQTAPKPFLSTATGLDILNGVSILPLLFMAASVFSTTAVAALLHFNRIVLATAGILALFAILEAP